MAKRKPPAALFEVIHTAPPPPLKLNKPRRTWWFGYRADSHRPQTMRSLHPAMIPDEPHRAPTSAAVSCSPEAELRARFAEAESAHEVAVFSADEPEGLEMEDEPASPPSPPSPRRPAVTLPPQLPASPTTAVKELCAGGLCIDRDRQEITFRLRYTTALLAGFIVLVLLGLSFVVGKRTADRNSDEQAMAALRNSQPDSSVMSVNRSGNSVPGRGTGNPTGDNAAHPRQPAPLPISPIANTGGGAPQRTIGLDYLVVQSYPDKKSAQDAADMLTAGGVPCTVEHGIRFAPNWFSVVTVAGYPPHTDEGTRLADSIRKIANKETNAGRHYHFDPQGYQWNQ